jgi:MYXO-CTERM domain-containing protein
MKRSIAFLFACSILSAASIAHAADIQDATRPQHAFDYDAAPSVLFVPTEPIPLTPADMCSYPQAGADNAGLGCIAGLAEAGDYTVPSTSEAVFEGLRAALMPYNVWVTSTRPPEYVPYMMILPGEEESAEGTSRTCTGAGIDCDGPQRNDIGLTNGGTMNCAMPDPVQTALIAFGYMSGLENNDNPMDPMFYPPDFSMPAVEFQDMCATQVAVLDEKGMEVNSPCVGLIHEAHCDMMEGQINSHLELLAVYGEGPATEDTTPPEVTEIGITEDMVLPAGSMLPLSATVTDDSGYVFVRWTLESTNEDFLMFDGNNDGLVCKSHNNVCEVDFEGNETPPVPYYQHDAGNYGAMDLAAVPGGDYTITFEASDLQGNTIEPVTVTITVEGGTADTSGGPADSTGNDDNAENADTNDDDGEDETSTGGGEGNDTTPADDETSGCSCNTTDATGGAAFMLLGLVGYGWSRRRPRS